MFKISFSDNKNVFKLFIIVIAQICGYSKSHWIVHFKMVNFMLYDYSCLLSNITFDKLLTDSMMLSWVLLKAKYWKPPDVWKEFLHIY